MQLDQVTQNERLTELAIGLLDEQPTPGRGIAALVYVACTLAKYLPARERTLLAHHLIDEAMRLNPRRH